MAGEKKQLGRFLTATRWKDLLERKTHRWGISSTRSGDLLGIVDWYNPWRQYTFEPVVSSIFDGEYLIAIAGFLKEIMEQHKEAE